jgi:hypothetical protein
MAVSFILVKRADVLSGQSQAIEAIKCFDIFVRIALFAAMDTDAECSLLASCICSCRTCQAIRLRRPHRSLVIVYVGHCHTVHVMLLDLITRLNGYETPHYVTVIFIFLLQVRLVSVVQIFSSELSL